MASRQCNKSETEKISFDTLTKKDLDKNDSIASDEIQEMHVRKPKPNGVSNYQRTINVTSPTDTMLSPCTKKLQAKKEKNYKRSEYLFLGKPLFLSNIFSKALKEEREKQAQEDASVKKIET
ncbi:13205_t:CDS:2 [Acaulospora morrowiae]|uniref:13205_t:CDS:1 n=1 Tax=Acaulospora morrowiae TaxID=94023 RepID=A0A9N9ATY7_9GLOM|nr:13205_t:CDS:2 [Acaulospora morrowiae]